MNRPDLATEGEILRKGFTVVIGVDEVGRGALAGPVVAGAVLLSVVGYRLSDRDSPVIGFSYTDKLGTGRQDSDNGKQKTDNRKFDWERLGIDDSKRLTARKREELDKVIRQQAIVGVGVGSVAEINRLGIVKATERAMRRAIANLKFKILNLKLQHERIFVLVDAFHVKYIPGVGLSNQKAIVKGDQKVLSIAAASIVAKVYRDWLMGNFYNNYKKYKSYNWQRNKGYGTKEHISVIRKLGLTRHHRLAFVKKFV